jgi:ribosome-associated translation inhibitor RaiA
MKRRYKIALGVATGLAVMFVAACSNPGSTTVDIRAEYPEYETLDALWADSDAAVEVTVQAQPRVDKINVAFPMPGQTLREEEKEGDVYTVVDVVVTKVWKGHYREGEEISVKQRGGEWEGESHIAEGVAYLAAGESYLLFLATFDEVGIPASLLNPVQAQYRLDQAGTPQALAGNALTIRIADLERLAES